MAFYAAVWAMPVVAPIIVATLTFIVLASVAIGVGASNDYPAIVTWSLVAISALIAGRVYRGVHTSLNTPVESNSYNSQYARVDRSVPVANGTRTSVSGQGLLPTPKIPSSITPQ